MSSGASISTRSIVFATSIGTETVPPRRAGAGTLCPMARTVTAPGVKSDSGSDAAARIARRESRTSEREPEGASTSMACPRAASAADSCSTYSLTSRRASHG